MIATSQTATPTPPTETRSIALPNLHINDTISFATDDPKSSYVTARVLHIKESGVIAVVLDEERAIVRLRWTEVLPPF